MAIPLKQSTAGQVITIGQFVDPAALGTTKDALTIANTDLKLHKFGATTLASKTSGGATFIANGVYYLTLDSTDTSVVGELTIYCTMSGAVPVKVDCIVYPANVYDSLIAATDKLEVDEAQIAGSTTAATRQSNLLLGAINSTTVQAAPAPTTTSFAGGLTGASYPDNCFRNGVIVWKTGSNVGLTPHVITAFTSSSGLFTVTPVLSFVPVAGDTFDIVGVGA